MSLLIIGLIVYVVVSVLIEFSKRPQPGPAGPPGRPFEMGRLPGTADHPGVPRTNGEYDEGDGPSELDQPSMEGEWSMTDLDAAGPGDEGDPAEGGNDEPAGGVVEGDAFEGRMVETAAPSPEPPQSDETDAGLDWGAWEDWDVADQEYLTDDDPAAQEQALFREPGDLYRGVVWSEVLSHRAGSRQTGGNKR